MASHNRIKEIGREIYADSEITEVLDEISFIHAEKVSSNTESLQTFSLETDELVNLADRIVSYLICDDYPGNRINDNFPLYLDINETFSRYKYKGVLKCFLTFKLHPF
jgi:hypothetical protein